MPRIDTLARRLLLLALLAAAPLVSAQTTPSAFGVDQLFALMAGQKRLATTFTEQKFIKGLEALSA